MVTAPAPARELVGANSGAGTSAGSIHSAGLATQASGVRISGAAGTQSVEPPPARLTRQQLQFLLRVTPAAIESQRVYGIPACVTIAQAILESATPQLGWGSSSLFRLANNPFGIKYCHFGPEQSPDAPQGNLASGAPIPDSGFPIPDKLPGKSDSGFRLPIASEDYGHFDAETWEIENGQKQYVLAQFQRFPNLNEAFRAHALLLRAPRYQPAFEARADWKQFAERLGPKTSQLDRDHCGYSTNPSYSADLIRLINLYRLNDPRGLEWYATGIDPESTAAPSGPGRDTESSGVATTAQAEGSAIGART